ncbi:hypothetical protein PPTG_23038 [Phytophthora nicotianae INRA-310]|uniref:Uncharacterized protein n=1 Tax=Phytophthora nicotianae (strain INRA-310) TaxID=761204 RepID=W2Q5Y9_PHYN3|nr:hypothetical protein PPTG_23038 [Phytophthora nicotianae INRA-310]ETN08567.1 hypothetical protein PPTG_23038 [Phytophthora nicotianae INRA-310]
MILSKFIRLYQATEYAPDDDSSTRTPVQNDIRELIASRWNLLCPPSDSTTIAYILGPSQDISTLPKRPLVNESSEELPDCGRSIQPAGESCFKRG